MTDPPALSVEPEEVRTLGRLAYHGTASPEIGLWHSPWPRCYPLSLKTSRMNVIAAAAAGSSR